MRWKNIKQHKAEAFKRFVGVERNTFDTIETEIREFSISSRHKILGKKRGPKPELSKEDELLMLFMYYRDTEPSP